MNGGSGVMECWSSNIPPLQYSNTPTLKMANHRKNQSGAVRLVPALKAFFLVLLIGGSCAGYVLQKNKIFELGQQIRQREARLDRLKWDNKLRADQLAALCLPARLAERAKELKLGLGPPQPGQTVWLNEFAPLRTSNSVSPLYVQGQTARPVTP